MLNAKRRHQAEVKARRRMRRFVALFGYAKKPAHWYGKNNVVCSCFGCSGQRTRNQRAKIKQTHMRVCTTEKPF